MSENTNNYEGKIATAFLEKKRKGIKRKEKNSTNIKKKEQELENLISIFGKKKIIGQKEIQKFLSAVVKGEVKDFAGLAPGLDVRLKAAKQLTDIQIINDLEDSTKKEVQTNVKFTDASSETLMNIDKEIKEEGDL